LERALNSTPEMGKEKGSGEDGKLPTQKGKVKTSLAPRDFQRGKCEGKKTFSEEDERTLLAAARREKEKSSSLTLYSGIGERQQRRREGR